MGRPKGYKVSEATKLLIKQTRQVNTEKKKEEKEKNTQPQ